MSIQNYTCTVEQGKKLRELGVTAKSQWVAALKKPGDIEAYCYQRSDGFIVNPENNARYNLWPKENIVQVYTLGELMRMDKRCCNNVSKSESKGWFWISEGENCDLVKGQYYTTEQAAGRLLIHLLENKYITTEQCNGALEG